MPLVASGPISRCAMVLVVVCGPLQPLVCVSLFSSYLAGLYIGARGLVVTSSPSPAFDVVLGCCPLLIVVAPDLQKATLDTLDTLDTRPLPSATTSDQRLNTNEVRSASPERPHHLLRFSLRISRPNLCYRLVSQLRPASAHASPIVLLG